MRLYSVHHRPGERDVTDPDVVLVKEGFCWPALFLPLVWLLYRMQFWGLLAYLLLTGLLTVAVTLSGMDDLTGLALSLVLSLLVASLANDWRSWRLSAKGYELVTVVAAKNLSQAERIFFLHEWQGDDDALIASPAKTFVPLPASSLTPFATPFDRR
ncbi:MAG: DUF2628 domain-containing protein [Rhodospirillaceae bacterium]|jgi:hypothetical protein|nr:DUF2628 domain-containing protein [Rhodospirillaceae bacterium]MBT5195405.1 DUF2628 domain-containing protein [Rhodospirillaceae bacterium]MBT5899229.1 DUF2628 domain-containing protein [Rhodospirillaceae bacterium]MBT7759882.1 DUF2628 domain-containing protein [Rhodospirillaceae bacterium]